MARWALEEFVIGCTVLDATIRRARSCALSWAGGAFDYASDLLEAPSPYCGYPIQIERGNVDGDEFDDMFVFTDCTATRNGLAGFYVVRGAVDAAVLQLDFVQTDFALIRFYLEDINGDGLDDVLFEAGTDFSINGSARLGLSVALGDGQYAEPVDVWTSDIPLSLDGNNVWEFDFADLNGDGTKEILAGRTVILDPVGSPVFADYISDCVFAPLIGSSRFCRQVISPGTASTTSCSLRLLAR